MKPTVKSLQITISGSNLTSLTIFFYSLRDWIRGRILEFANVAWTKHLIDRVPSPEPEALRNLAGLFISYGQTNHARQLVLLGRSKYPDVSVFFGDGIVYSREDVSEVDMDKLFEGSFKEANRVAVELWRQRRFESAMHLYERMTQRIPQSALAWANLGASYSSLENYKLAEESFQHAMSLDPLNETVTEMYLKFKQKGLDLARQSTLTAHRISMTSKSTESPAAAAISGDSTSSLDTKFVKKKDSL